MTNTFVLPSWPGAYLAGARVSTNQRAWHRKHVTTVTSVLKVLSTKCIPFFCFLLCNHHPTPLFINMLILLPTLVSALHMLQYYKLVPCSRETFEGENFREFQAIRKRCISELRKCWYVSRSNQRSSVQDVKSTLCTNRVHHFQSVT